MTLYRIRHVLLFVLSNYFYLWLMFVIFEDYFSNTKKHSIVFLFSVYLRFEIMRYRYVQFVNFASFQFMINELYNFAPRGFEFVVLFNRGWKIAFLCGPILDLIFSIGFLQFFLMYEEIEFKEPCVCFIEWSQVVVSLHSDSFINRITCRLTPMRSINPIH